MGGISPEYYSINDYSVEKGVVNHNSICIYIGFNRSNYIASSTCLFIKWSMCGFQESVLSTIRPRNLVYELLDILLLSIHILMSMGWLFFVLKCTWWVFSIYNERYFFFLTTYLHFQELFQYSSGIPQSCRVQVCSYHWQTKLVLPSCLWLHVNCLCTKEAVWDPIQSLLVFNV
jgi:hypothetical protein